MRFRSVVGVIIAGIALLCLVSCEKEEVHEVVDDIQKMSVNSNPKVKGMEVVDLALYADQSMYFYITDPTSGNYLYESVVLEAGTSLDEIILYKSLEKGSYPCEFTVVSVDAEGITTGKSTMDITLEVE